ncbi:MAG TPA: Fe-S protein assembly co-chaperone HscB [Polyangiaceae bacterium]
MSDPFETLGLPAAFDLDPPALEARHRELSRALHPDRYAGRPSSERREALGRAIQVNEAMRVLRDPIRRAEALLARRGYLVSESGRAPVSPALLMEVMERREALAAARGARDLARVRQLAGGVRAREAELTAVLARSFSTEPADFARIEALLGELRYHRRFLDEAGAIEDDLDGGGP